MPVLSVVDDTAHWIMHTQFVRKFSVLNDAASLTSNLVICKEAECPLSVQFCYSSFSHVFRRNGNTCSNRGFDTYNISSWKHCISPSQDPYK